MAEVLKIPAHQPTSVESMLKEEFINPMGISQGEIAKAMGVGRKTVNDLCGGRRGVTAETAFLLAKVLGTTSEFWLNLQLINDLWLAQHSEIWSASSSMHSPCGRRLAANDCIVLSYRL